MTATDGAPGIPGILASLSFPVHGCRFLAAPSRTAFSKSASRVWRA
jgi:hypothetical protein